jgi:hypothetical protein
MRFLSFGIVSLLGLSACGTDATQPPVEPEARSTWYQDVAPIMAKHCMTCHQEGGIGPFLLTDYDSAKEMSSFAIDAIGRGVMPPFDAREEADCTPRFGWVDDPRLSNLEKQKLQEWVDDGHPLGTVAEIPAIPVADLPNPTMRLTPDVGFVTSGDRDQFFCYILDPGNTDLQWLTGLQVLPDVTEVVHHAVITEVAPGPDQDALVTRAGGVGVPFDCETLGTPSDFVVHIWTPGNQPMSTSDEIAVPVVAGAKLVMQIHYHPAGQVHNADKTAIDLRFSQTWPQKMYFVTAFGNSFNAASGLLPGPGDGVNGPEFLVPKNVAEHTEHMRITIPDLGGLTDVRLFSANPHMHLIGTHISSTIERPAARGDDPQNECLANGAWNFDWQRTYQYDAPLAKLPTVQTGDVIDVKCSWDNTIENPFVQRMLDDSGLSQPIDVALGEQTTNEMCLEIFGLAIPAPAEPAQGKPRPKTIDFPAALAQMKVNPNMLK